MLNAKWILFQPCNIWNKLLFDNIDVCFDQHAKSNFHSPISLKQQSTCRHVTPLNGHIIKIPSQPVLHSVCLAEKQQILILYSFSFNLPGERTKDLLHWSKTCLPLYHRGIRKPLDLNLSKLESTYHNNDSCHFGHLIINNGVLSKFK